MEIEGIKSQCGEYFILRIDHGGKPDYVRASRVAMLAFCEELNTPVANPVLREACDRLKEKIRALLRSEDG